MTTSSHCFFGKYRELVLAIALFLVLDIGVLAFNFYTSRKIGNDTSLINTAGELRMYTQQLTKALLTLEQETRNALPVQSSLAQLGEARTMFNGSLETLNGAVRSGSSTSFLDPEETPGSAVALLDALEKQWRPVDALIAPVMQEAEPALALVELASTKALTRNIKLMQQADDLTRFLEQRTLKKAELMRRIQLLAIAAAALNFVFIIVKFVRRLRRSDDEAERAREETGQILATVGEGLLLVNRDGRVGGQRSRSLDAMLGRKIAAGDDFNALIRELFKPDDAEAAEHFVEVLFNKKVKPALLVQLNPLREIEVCGGSAARQRGGHYLSFEFTQVRRENTIEALLVTVFDVSQEVHLSRELASARERARSDVELLLGVLDQEPRVVSDFLGATRDRLQTINRDLESVKATPAAYRTLVDRVAGDVHRIKGEAAALTLATIERAAHQFEDTLSLLRRRNDLGGDDLIPVAVEMSALTEQVLRVETVITKVRKFSTASADSALAQECRLRGILTAAEHLALRVASDLDKKVRVKLNSPKLSLVPDGLARLLAETLPQLVRNAVVHGIESSEERVRQGKPDTGLISIDIGIEPDGVMSISVHDDGRGLVPDSIRDALVARGLKSRQEAASMADQEVVSTLFESGFSLLDSAGLHAGRGDGLSVVKESLARVGGRLRIASKPSAYTQFMFRLKAPVWLTA